MWCVDDRVLLGLAAQGQADYAQDTSEARKEPVSLWLTAFAKLLNATDKWEQLEQSLPRT